MKTKIKWAVNVISLLVISGLVFFTMGVMFNDLPNPSMGLYDVITYCAIIFIGGTLAAIHTKVLIQDIFKLLPANDKEGVK